MKRHLSDLEIDSYQNQGAILICYEHNYHDKKHIFHAVCWKNNDNFVNVMIKGESLKEIRFLLRAIGIESPEPLSNEVQTGKTIEARRVKEKAAQKEKEKEQEKKQEDKIETSTL